MKVLLLLFLFLYPFLFPSPFLFRFQVVGRSVITFSVCIFVLTTGVGVASGRYLVIIFVGLCRCFVSILVGVDAVVAMSPSRLFTLILFILYICVGDKVFLFHFFFFFFFGGGGQSLYLVHLNNEPDFSYVTWRHLCLYFVLGRGQFRCTLQ